jgi:hypothetical protein
LRRLLLGLPLDWSEVSRISADVSGLAIGDIGSIAKKGYQVLRIAYKGRFSPRPFTSSGCMTRSISLPRWGFELIPYAQIDPKTFENKVHLLGMMATKHCEELSHLVPSRRKIRQVGSRIERGRQLSSCLQELTMLAAQLSDPLTNGRTNQLQFFEKTSRPFGGENMFLQQLLKAYHFLPSPRRPAVLAPRRWGDKRRLKFVHRCEQASMLVTGLARYILLP